MKTMMTLIVGVNLLVITMLAYKLGVKDQREFYQGFLVGQQSVWNDNALKDGEVYGRVYLELAKSHVSIKSKGAK